MLTTTLSKPQSMSLGLPDKNEDDKKLISLMKIEQQLYCCDNKLTFYMGLLETPIAGPKDISYGREGVRKELLKRKEEVLAYSTAKGKRTKV
jgi:hypothetical protein